MPSVPIEIAPPNGSMLIKPLGQMTAINSVGELGMVKKEDLIGDFIGEGLEATLNADGNVKMFPMFGCGNSCSYKGTWKYDGRILKIETICYSTYSSGSPFNKTYLPIRCDSMLVFLPYYSSSIDIGEQYKNLCKAYNARIWWDFLVKKLPTQAPVKPLAIPQQYQNLLLDKPLICQINSLEGDSILLLNKGSADGLFTDLYLYRTYQMLIQTEPEEYMPEFLECKVIKVTANTAQAKITSTPSWWRGTSKEFVHLRTLKQGDTLYSVK